MITSKIFYDLKAVFVFKLKRFVVQTKENLVATSPQPKADKSPSMVRPLGASLHPQQQSMRALLHSPEPPPMYIAVE